jgi:hypothetical protein
MLGKPCCDDSHAMQAAYWKTEKKSAGRLRKWLEKQVKVET